MSVDNSFLSSVQSLRHVPIFSNSFRSIIIITAFYSRQNDVKVVCDFETSIYAQLCSRIELAGKERRESHLLAAAKSMSLVASVIVLIECSDSLQISTFPLTSLIVSFSGLSALSVLFTIRSNIFS